MTVVRPQASKLPAAAKVVALPDAGFFMDNDFSRKSGWVAAQQWVYANQNCSAGVPRGCLYVTLWPDLHRIDWFVPDGHVHT